MMTSTIRRFAAVSVISLISSVSYAGTIVQCGGQAVCSSTFSIDFNGSAGVGGGEFLYDSASGDISLNLNPATFVGNAQVNGAGTGIMWMMGDGSQVMLNSLSGNADPVLLFGVGASTGASGATFGFNFDLPIELEGLILAESSISYSLTASGLPGAQIQGIGGDKILRAFEVDTTFLGIGSINKGVDAGDDFGFAASGLLTQNSSVYTASNTFTGDAQYDLMSVQLDFSLTPNSSVGISGGVSQTVIPVPAAVWLFASALCALGVFQRKQ